MIFRIKTPSQLLKAFLQSYADQFSGISLLLIDKSPPCETMFLIFEKRGTPLNSTLY